MSDSPPNPFGASGSALGYLYQCRWALVTFLRRLAPGDTIDVAIEKLDDVSFEKNGTSIELIQTKHHVDTAANLTDNSPELWKSIRVWAEGVRRGDVRLPGVLRPSSRRRRRPLEVSQPCSGPVRTDVSPMRMRG